MAECIHATWRASDAGWTCDRCGVGTDLLPQVDPLPHYRQGRPPPLEAVELVPEVLSTDSRPADAPPVPRAVLGLQRAAQAAGWAAEVAYSRAPERAVRVGEYKITEAYAVWAGVHPVTGWRFNAVHNLKAWRSTAIWKRGRPRFRYATITDLHQFVACMGEVGMPWFKAVHARVEDAAARAKARPPNQKPKEGSS